MPHRSRVIDVLAKEQGIGPGAHASTGQPTNLHTLIEREVQPGYQAIGVDGERVRQDYEVRLLAGINAYDLLPGRGSIVGGRQVGILNVEEVQVNVREDSAGDGDRRPVLDLLTFPDDASARAADKVLDRADVGDHVRDLVVFSAVGVGYEDHKEVRRTPVEVRLNALGGLLHRGLQSMLL